MDAKKKQMCDMIDGMRDELLSMGDSIFDRPELGFEEYFASNLIEDFLEKNGFHVERGLGSLKTAFRAIYEHGTGGPSIGLLCEYDALAGIGHACGHHLQGPCIAAAAIALSKADIKEPYKIVVYGTPAEEGGGGKSVMLKEGFIGDVDVALMMHGSQTTTCDIKSMAIHHIDVTYEGVGSHAAIAPHKGRSALDALLLAFQGTEFLREHVPEDTRIHYTVADTFDIPANVVPCKAKGTFILRSYNSFVLEKVRERFENVIRGAAMMTETEATIEYTSSMPGKIPVLSLNKVLIDCAEEIGAPNISEPRKKPGSTDLAEVMQHIPGSCIRVSFAPLTAAPHSREYLDNGKSETGHAAIIYGAKTLANASYELITKPELMKEIQDEFKERKEKMKKEA